MLTLSSSRSPEKKYDDTNGIPAIVPTVCASRSRISHAEHPDLFLFNLPPSINEGFRSISYLSEWLLRPREGTNRSSAFKYAYNTDEDMYTWLERPENSLRLLQVGRGMTAGGLIEGSLNVADKCGTRIYYTFEPRVLTMYAESSHSVPLGRPPEGRRRR